MAREIVKEVDLNEVGMDVDNLAEIGKEVIDSHGTPIEAFRYRTTVTQLRINLSIAQSLNKMVAIFEREEQRLRDKGK